MATGFLRDDAGADRHRPRRRRRFRTLFTALGASILVLSHLTNVSATDNLWRSWISVPGPNCYDHYARYDYLSNVPTGDYRSRIYDGKGRWNAVGRELYFARTSTDVRVWVGYQRPGWPNENVLALTNLNVLMSKYVTNATIDFNPIYSWYTGATLPVPATRYDVLSVAAHEFGHVVALHHGGGSDVMAPTFAEGEARRTLTTHDRDGIKALYSTRTC